MRVTDHGGHVTESLSDSWGNRIVAREFAQGSVTDVREVRYGFDVQNQLRRVTPHAGAAGKANQRYEYDYSHVGEVTSAKVPGRQAETYVYELSSGRLVAEQNGYLSDEGKHWSYLYDAYGNVTQSGFNAGGPRASYTAPETLLIEHDFDYTVGSVTFGTATSSRTRMLDEDAWIVSAAKYDRNAEPCGFATGSTSSSTLDYTDADFVDVISLYNSERLPSYGAATYAIPGHALRTTSAPRYTSDLRLDASDYWLYAGTTPGYRPLRYAARLGEVEYNRFGDLAYEKVAHVNGHTLQQVDYGYDAIGRLLTINQPLSGSTAPLISSQDGRLAPGLPYPNIPSASAPQTERDIFFEEIQHEGRTSGSGFEVEHRGLIQQTIKQTKGRRPVLESYGYDGFHQITGFEVRELYSATSSVSAYTHSRHALALYAYDGYGRPTEIGRRGYTAPPAGSTASSVDEEFDRLTYTYADAGGVDAGPQVRKILDGSFSSGSSRGHVRNSSTSGYSFNANGDQTYDPYRALRFVYNEFGLAKTVTVAWGANAGARLEYRYTADGILRVGSEYDRAGQEVSRVHYIGGMRVDVVKDEVYVPNGSGAVTLDRNNAATDVYHQTDHLGNVMLAYRDADGDGVINTASADEVLEESRFFPYGYKQEAYTRQTASVPFGYNGAEEVEGYGLNLTTFRTMAPETGLWGQSDPKADMAYHSSPYAAMGANPITHADPHGDVLPLLVVAAIAGGMVNATVQGHLGNIHSVGDMAISFGVGAASAAAGAGVGSGVSAALAGGSFGAGFAGSTGVASQGFIAGALSGAAAGAAGGFISGTGNALANHAGPGNALRAGLQSATIGALSGGLTGGISGGIQASKGGADFWNGKLRASLAEGVGAHGIPSPVTSVYGKYVGKFEGVSIYEDAALGGGGVTLPGHGIVVGEGSFSQNMRPFLVKHEFGHILQSRITGIPKFYNRVGVPSLYSASTNPANHHTFWTEVSANNLSQQFFAPAHWSAGEFPLQFRSVADKEQAARVIRAPNYFGN